MQIEHTAGPITLVRWCSSRCAEVCAALAERHWWDTPPRAFVKAAARADRSIAVDQHVTPPVVSTIPPQRLPTPQVAHGDAGAVRGHDALTLATQSACQGAENVLIGQLIGSSTSRRPSASHICGLLSRRPSNSIRTPPLQGSTYTIPWA